MSNATPEQPVITSTSPLRVLKSDSFIEKAFLLLLTALLSGMLVPLIIKSIDNAREKREALSRAQAKLFDDVSETLLTCETLMLDISWFGTQDAKNAEMQKKAFERYTERSVDLVAKWRVQSSRAQTFASPHVSKKLNAFQIRFFDEQDTPMNRQWVKCGSECDWQQMHKKNEAMLGEANALIVELANDLGLTKK
jgi:hypothetical protein